MAHLSTSRHARLSQKSWQAMKISKIEMESSTLDTGLKFPSIPFQLGTMATVLSTWERGHLGRLFFPGPAGWKPALPAPSIHTLS